MYKSRFLRHGSMPPSARYNTDSYSSSSFSRSARSSSIAPSSRARESSVAPFRSGSIAPVRASSVAPIRSTVSYRSSSVAPSYRASSVAPAPSSYSRTSYRSSSVAPMRSTYVAPYRASSVAPLRASSVAPMRASSLAPSSSNSFRSTSIAPQNRLSNRLDLTIPSRNFGTRLAYQKVEREVKPAIYDEYYGMTYIPSGGRDSWSAYRISDETLDDNDELVYQSAKKDYEVMKRVNKQIARAMSVPPPQHTPVAPATRRFTPQPMPQVVQVKKQVNHIAYRPPPVVKPGVYRTPQPAVRVTYSTVEDGADLLSSKEKFAVRESADLGQPAALKALKQRLSEAKTDMARTKQAYNKYNQPDAELSKIDAEVKSITSKRNLRAEQMEYEKIAAENKGIKDLRRKIKATLRQSKLNY